MSEDDRFWAAIEQRTRSRGRAFLENTQICKA